MHRTIALVCLLSVAIVANAEVQIYFTNGSTQSYGLADVADALNPSAAITSNDNLAEYSDNLDVTGSGAPYDMMDPTMFAPYTTSGVRRPPGSTCPVIGAPGDVIYIWGKFDDSYATNATLRWIHGGIAEADCETGEPLTEFDGQFDQPIFADLGGQVAWYKFDAMGSLGTERWDGASTEADNYATFRNNPQLLTAVSAYGIRANATILPQPLGQAKAVGGEDIFLLGAVAASALDPNKCYTYAVRADDQLGEPSFVIGSTPEAPVADCFSIVPEPASLLLIGLAGLLIRRR